MGFLGSLIAAACCLGIPFVIATITAVGAGFLIQDKYLLPLLALFLLVSVVGTTLSMRRHRQKSPLGFAVAGSLLTLGGALWLPAAAYVGIALLLLAALLDYRAGRATR